MTICNSMKTAVEKRLVAKDSIEKISGELCDGIKFPKTKIIHIIREIKPQGYLQENKEWLGYRGGGGLGKKKHKKAELENIPVQPETELSDEIKTKYIDFIRKCLYEHPQDWKDIIMKCIKIIEDELSITPIEEPAPISETSPTPTDEREQAISGD